MIIGTAHFISKQAAFAYYSSQWASQSMADIERKLFFKEIYIGQPSTKEGEKLLINKEEGRYFIEEQAA